MIPAKMKVDGDSRAWNGQKWVEKAFPQQNSDRWASDEGRVAENAAAFGGRMGSRVTDHRPEGL